MASLRKIFDTIPTASEAPAPERVQFTVVLLCTDVLGEPSSWNQAKKSLIDSIGSQLGSADGRCVVNFKLIPVRL